MTVFRTWRDVLAEEEAPAAGLRSMALLTEDTEPVALSAGPTIDRPAGDGPPPCCSVGRIPADMLVWYGGIGQEALVRVRDLLPNLAGVPDENVYLCDGCRAKIERERVLSPEEMPRAWPLEGDDVTV